LRFFHEGQFEGARIRLPTHLCRRPAEPTDPDVKIFYATLLRLLKENVAFRDGAWSQIEPQPAWLGNGSFEGFVSWIWAGPAGNRYLVVVNYVGSRGQCRVPLALPEFKGRCVQLVDKMGSEVYERGGTELVEPGLYIDLPAWRYNVFELTFR
jgi:hypothetical protein